MRRNTNATLSIGVILVALMLVILLFAGRDSQQTSPPPDPLEDDTEPSAVHLNESEARATDIAHIAEETGWPVEDVEQAITFQKRFDEYTQTLHDRFPDQISAVWLEPVPGTKGYVLFTAEVPPEAMVELEAQDLLDAGNVVLLGGGEISMADHHRRAELAHDTLLEMEYTNLVTAFDADEQVIQIELKLPEGVAEPDRKELAASIQKRLQAERTESGKPRFHGRAATVLPDDLKLKVYRYAAPTAGPPNETSPLTVWDAGGVMGAPEASSGTGTLEITDRCVSLIHDNGRTTLLVWPWPTSWNASLQTIEFVSVSDERARLRDGDRISAGGRAGPYTLAGGDPPDTEEPPMPAPPLLATPDPACRADESFIVFSATVEASD